MLSLDQSQGKCCLQSSTSDDCTKTHFTCTDKLPTSFNYHKYAYCSYDPVKCGAKQRTLISKQTQQKVLTSLDFGYQDVCPYYIVSDTDLPFNTEVKITVNNVANADVYLLLGTSLESITS
jgi:hypothetical protein